MTLALRLARALVPGRVDRTDEALIRSASEANAAKQLSREDLAQTARDRGVDFATALLYARTCEEPVNRKLLEMLAAGDRPPFDFDSGGLKLLVVPAALYREFRSYRGDGIDVRAAAAALGLESETVPVASVGGVRENARIIAQAVERATEPGLILATLSKSGADARFAFESGFIPPGRVKGWIQIGGVLRGTPLADDVLQSGFFRRALIYGFLRARGGGRAIAADLSYAAASLLAAEPAAPAGVRAISFIGVPLRRHLSGSSLRRHGRLAPLGPNDGMTLLADAILRPGLVCPLWGCDHFFKIPGLQLLLKRSLAYLCSECAPGPPSRELGTEFTKAVCV